MSIPVIQSGGATTDTTMPIAVADLLLSGMRSAAGVAIDGVYLFSLDDPASYARQAAPVDTDPVKNLAGGSDGAMRIETQSSSGSPGWDSAAKALTFAAVKRGPTGARTPASWIARFDQTLHPANNQYFLLTAYIKLPTSGNWPASGSTVHVLAGTSASGSSSIDLISIAIVNVAGVNQIWARRRVSAGVYVTQIINAADIPYGQWCQISAYRNAAGFGMRIKSAAAVASPASVAVGAKTTDDLSAQYMCWGLGDAGGTYVTTYSHEVSRGFIIDLDTVPIADIPALLDADWSRQIARGRIS